MFPTKRRVCGLSRRRASVHEFVQMLPLLFLAFLGIATPSSALSPISCSVSLSGTTWPLTESLDTFTTDDTLTVDWSCNGTSSASDTLSLSPQGQDCSCIVPDVEPASPSPCVVMYIGEQATGRSVFPAGALTSNTGNHTLTVFSRDGSLPDAATSSNCAHLGTSEFVFNVVAKPKLIVATDPCTQGSPCISENAAGSVFPDTITYGFALNSVPAADVTVVLTVIQTSYPQPHDEFTISPSILSFAAGTASSTSRDIVVTAVDDNWSEDTVTWVIRHTSVSTDPMYDGLTMEYSILAADDDRIGVLYERPSPIPNDSTAPIVLYEGIDKVTRNATCYGNGIEGTIRLLSQPIGPVTLTLSTLEDGESMPRFSRLITEPATLSFGPTTWNVSQQVYIAASDDGEAFGDWTARLAITSKSSVDSAYEIPRVGNPGVANSGVIRHGVSEARSMVGGSGWIPFNVVEDDRSGVRLTTNLPSLTTWTDLGEGSPPLEYQLELLSQPALPTFVVLVNNCTSRQKESLSVSLAGKNLTQIALSQGAKEFLVPLLEVNGITDYVHVMAVNDTNWDVPIHIVATPKDDEVKYNSSDSLECALRQFIVSKDPKYNDPYGNVTEFIGLLTIAKAGTTGQMSGASGGGAALVSINEALREKVYKLFSFHTPTGYYLEYPRNFVRSIEWTDSGNNTTTGTNSTGTNSTSVPTKAPVVVGIFTNAPTSAPTGYNNECGRYPRFDTTEAYFNLVVLDNDSSVMSKVAAEYLSYIGGMAILLLVLATCYERRLKFYSNAYHDIDELNDAAKKAAALALEGTGIEKFGESAWTQSGQLNNQSDKFQENNEKAENEVKKKADEDAERQKLERFKVLDLSLYIVALLDELQFATLLSQTSAVSLHSAVYPYFAHGFWWSNFQLSILGPHSKVVDMHTDGQVAVNAELLFANCLFTFMFVLSFTHVLRRTLRYVMLKKHRRRLSLVFPEPEAQDEDKDLAKITKLESMRLRKSILRVQRSSLVASALSTHPQSTRTLVERVKDKHGNVQLKKAQTSGAFGLKSKGGASPGYKPVVNKYAPTPVQTGSHSGNWLQNYAPKQALTPSRRRQVELAKARAQDRFLRAWDMATTPWLWELPVLLVGFPGLMQSSSLVAVRHPWTTGVVGMIVLATFAPWLLLFCLRKIQHDVIPMRTVHYHKIALELNKHATLDDDPEDEDSASGVDSGMKAGEKNSGTKAGKARLTNDNKRPHNHSLPDANGKSMTAIEEFNVEVDKADKGASGESGDDKGKKKRRSSSTSTAYSATDIANFIPGMVLSNSDEDHDVLGYWISDPEHSRYTLQFGILFTSLAGSHPYTMLWWPMRLVKSIALAAVFAAFSNSESEVMQQSQCMFMALTEISFMLWFLLRPAYRSPTANFITAFSLFGHAACFFASAWLVDGTVLGISFNRDTIERSLIVTSGVLVFQSFTLQIHSIFHAWLSYFFNTYVRRCLPCLKTQAQMVHELELIDRNMKSDEEFELDELMKQASALGYKMENPLSAEESLNTAGLQRLMTTGALLMQRDIVSSMKGGVLPPLRGVQTMGPREMKAGIQQQKRDSEVAAAQKRKSFLS